MKKLREENKKEIESKDLCKEIERPKNIIQTKKKKINVRLSETQQFRKHLEWFMKKY